MDNEPRVNLPLGRLIITIDPGTTNMAMSTSKLMYSDCTTKSLILSHNPPIQIFRNWSLMLSNIKPEHDYPISSVYYHEDGTIIAGNAVHAQYYRSDFDSRKLIRHIKLMSHNSKGDELLQRVQSKVQHQLDFLNKTTEGVLRDLGKFLLDELFVARERYSYLQDMHQDLSELDIEVVVLVPPGNATVYHEQVRSAFIYNNIPLSSISLDSEVAAIFRGYAFRDIHLQTPEHQWKAGDRYVIADAGGGFGCFVRFRLTSLDPVEFVQESEGTSSVCGSEIVTLAFEELARKLVPEDFQRREEEIAMMVNLFNDQWKLHFNEKQEGIEIRKTGSFDQYWVFSGHELSGCFMPCIEKLVDGIVEQVGREPVQCIFQTGGFFSSYFLRVQVSARAEAKLSRSLPFRRITGKDCGVYGAALSRIDGTFVKQRYAKQTIAVSEWVVVPDDFPNDKRDLLFTQTFPRSGELEYMYTAKYIEKKGRSIDAPSVEITTAEDRQFESQIYLDRGQTSVDFSENVFHFDFHPGNQLRAIYLDDGSWVNEAFEPIPGPILTQTYNWPFNFHNDYGITYDNFDENADPNVVSYRLRCKADEMHSRIWIEVHCTRTICANHPHLGTYIQLDEVVKGPLYGTHDISKHLKESINVASDSASAPRTSSQHDSNSASAGPSSSRSRKRDREPDKLIMHRISREDAIAQRDIRASKRRR